MRMCTHREAPVHAQVDGDGDVVKRVDVDWLGPPPHALLALTLHLQRDTEGS